MEQMIITIKRDGGTEIEVDGTKGTHCIQLTQAIETLLGKVDDRLLKNDFYRDIKTGQGIQLKQIDRDRTFK